MELFSQDASLQAAPSGQIRFSGNGYGSWENPGPLIILHYYDRQHPRKQVAAAPSGDGNVFGTAGTPSLSAKGEIAIRRVSESELRVVADFSNVHIRVELTIRLTPDPSGFVVRIEDDGITEGMPRLYRVLGLEVLPEFGSARTGESGYLTLPNWSGCQTFFDKSYPREVWQTIYSSNDQWENVCNMPVFGLTRGQGTLCGLVAAGDYDAQLVCRLHWEQAQTNSIHPYLVYRWEQQDERITGPREVRYAFAPAKYEGGEGYVFCGKVYRDFLRRERGLLSWEEKAKSRPVVLDYRDRFFLKIFMAYKEPQADGHGPYHSTCTFAEARQILEECLNRGMKKLTAILVGWGQDGHDGMPPTRFPVDERLGGEAELRKLIAWCQEKDILLGVHDSYGGYYSCSPEFNTDDLIKHRTGEYWESIIWSGGQSHIACPRVYVEKQVKRDVPAVRALGLHGHHHVDAVGSFVPCFSKEHPLEDRAAFTGKVREMFEFITAEMGSVSTEMPFGPYFDVVDGFFHSYTKPSPWHRASLVGQFFLDRTVPLLQIALHGSVNCCESIGSFSESPLYWLDLGLCPQWEVCVRASESFGISEFSSVAGQLFETYDRYYGPGNLLPRLNGLSIEGRWELENGITRTRYSDGTVVSVNHGATAQEGIAPSGFQIGNV